MDDRQLTLIMAAIILAGADHYEAPAGYTTDEALQLAQVLIKSLPPASMTPPPPAIPPQPAPVIDAAPEPEPDQATMHRRRK